MSPSRATTTGSLWITLLLTACGGPESTQSQANQTGGRTAGIGGSTANVTSNATGGVMLKATGGTSNATTDPSSGGTVAAGGSTTAANSSTRVTGGTHSNSGGSLATGGSGASTGSGGQTLRTSGLGGSSGGSSHVGGSTNTGTGVLGGNAGAGGTVGSSIGLGGASGSVSTVSGGASTMGGTSTAATGMNTAGRTSTTGGQPATGGSAASGGLTANGGSTAVSCPSTVLKAGDSTRTIQSGGRSRTYVLHVPSGYTGNTAVPLLVDFHPHGSTGPDWRTSSPYVKLADADGVISAFPSAIGDWNVGPCCADGVDDVGFAKDLVKEVKSLACIDGKRVYAAGFSMGGGMTNYVACHAADVFAAFAPAAFDILQEIVTDCKPGRPITVAAFRGTNDPYVPYAGGLSNLVKPINFLGAVASMKKWAEWNGCTGSAADIGNGCQGYAASQCQGEEVILCTKQGGEHEAANANLTWPVLKRHSLP